MLSAPEAESLLSKLCIDLGFCLPPEAHKRLGKNPPADVNEFADAVFVAEGLDPSTTDRNLYRQVRAMVGEAFRRSEEEWGLNISKDG